MKRILCAVLAVVCLLVPVAAKEKYATAMDLYQSWEGEYPDYVCGVWSESGGGHLTIAVVDVDAKAKILGQVEDVSTMTLILQKYSQKELLAIQDAMIPYMERGWIWTTALDESNNRVVVGLNLDNRSAEMDAFVMDTVAQYGTAVVFEKGYPVELSVGDQLDISVSQDQPWWLIGAAVLFAVACLMLAARHRRRALLTTAGNTVSDTALTEQIRQTPLAPDEELEKKIYESVR